MFVSRSAADRGSPTSAPRTLSHIPQKGRHRAFSWDFVVSLDGERVRSSEHNVNVTRRGAYPAAGGHTTGFSASHCTFPAPSLPTAAAPVQPHIDSAKITDLTEN